MASRRAVATRTILASESQAPRPPQSFDSQLSGTIEQRRAANGVVRVSMRLRLLAAPHGQLRIELRGAPVGEGVSMTASGVSFVPATTRAVYYGRVTGLEGPVVAATVRDAAGDVLQLTARLALDPSTGRATGTVAAESGG
jgi:hypothetical protein